MTRRCEPYRRGDGFVSYTELTEPTREALARRSTRSPSRSRRSAQVVVATGVTRRPRRELDARVAGSLGAGAGGRRAPRGGARRRARCGDDGGAAARRRRSPFYGAHQAGIATPAQDRLLFAAFDLIDRRAATSSRDLLRTWTDAGARG